MRVSITKIYRTDKNKEGQVLMGRNGKPYTKISIKTKEHGDVWLGGFGGIMTND